MRQTFPPRGWPFCSLSEASRTSCPALPLPKFQLGQVWNSGTSQTGPKSAAKLITQIQTNRELTHFENSSSLCPNSGNLPHCRSPFLCALSTSNIGSVSHPAETGLSHLSFRAYGPRNLMKTAQRHLLVLEHQLVEMGHGNLPITLT